MTQSEPLGKVKTSANSILEEVWLLGLPPSSRYLDFAEGFRISRTFPIQKVARVIEVKIEVREFFAPD